MPGLSVNQFATQHLYYKKKYVGNLTRNFTCSTKLSLAIKMRKLPRTALYLFSYIFKPSSFILYMSYFKYILIFQYATISKQKLISTLTSFFLLADYLSDKLTSQKAVKRIEDCKYFTSIQNLPDASFDLSFTA